MTAREIKLRETLQDLKNELGEVREMSEDKVSALYKVDLKSEAITLISEEIHSTEAEIESITSYDPFYDPVGEIFGSYENMNSQFV